MVARLRARMFDLLDADKSGSISKFEMFEAVKAMAVVTAAQLRIALLPHIRRITENTYTNQLR